MQPPIFLWNQKVLTLFLGGEQVLWPAVQQSLQLVSANPSALGSQYWRPCCWNVKHDTQTVYCILFLQSLWLKEGYLAANFSERGTHFDTSVCWGDVKCLVSWNICRKLVTFCCKKLLLSVGIFCRSRQIVWRVRERFTDWLIVLIQLSHLIQSDLVNWLKDSQKRTVQNNDMFTDWTSLLQWLETDLLLKCTHYLSVLFFTSQPGTPFTANTSSVRTLLISRRWRYCNSLPLRFFNFVFFILFASKSSQNAADFVGLSIF